MNLKRQNLYLVLVLLTGLFFISCASAPAAEETAEEVVNDTAEGVTETVAIDASRVKEARNNADTAKITAVNAKAGKAASEEFTAAEALYSQGAEAETAGDMEAAYGAFVSAAEAYNKAASTADANRQAAIEAMEAADRAIAQAEEKASEATEEAKKESE